MKTKAKTYRPVWVSLSEIEARHNGYFFTPDACRFFRSRLPEGGLADKFGTVFFVTSEKGPSGVRRYTVRTQTAKGDPRHIGDAGGFQSFATGAAAKRHARQLATVSHPPCFYTVAMGLAAGCLDNPGNRDHWLARAGVRVRHADGSIRTRGRDYTFEDWSRLARLIHD